jgi:hypothetical protein
MTKEGDMDLSSIGEDLVKDPEGHWIVGENNSSADFSKNIEK